MRGTHAVLQEQCPICYYSFMPGAIVIMRVVEQGVNSVTGKPCGVMVEYIHEYCALPSERKEPS